MCCVTACEFVAKCSELFAHVNIVIFHYHLTKMSSHEETPEIKNLATRTDNTVDAKQQEEKELVLLMMEMSCNFHNKGITSYKKPDGGVFEVKGAMKTVLENGKYVEVKDITAEEVHEAFRCGIRATNTNAATAAKERQRKCISLPHKKIPYFCSKCEQIHESGAMYDAHVMEHWTPLTSAASVTSVMTIPGRMQQSKIFMSWVGAVKEGTIVIFS